MIPVQYLDLVDQYPCPTSYIRDVYRVYSVLIILVSKIRRTYWQISWTALKTATWILRIRMPFSNLNFKSTIYIVYILTIHQRSPIQDAEPLLYHQRERWPQAHHIQMSKLVLLLFSSDPDPTCLNGNIILFSSWTKYKQESTNVSFKWSGSDFFELSRIRGKQISDPHPWVTIPIPIPCVNLCRSYSIWYYRQVVAKSHSLPELRGAIDVLKSRYSFSLSLCPCLILQTVGFQISHSLP